MCPAFANSVDPDQLASEEALFAIKYVNSYQQTGSSNLIGLKLEMGVVSQFIQHDKGRVATVKLQWLKHWWLVYRG